MEQSLSIDLLRRLKLNGYTALIPKAKRNDLQVFAISNYPVNELQDKDPNAPFHEDDILAIDELLLHEENLTLEGIVVLPDEDLSSAL
ncbi:hypothetical protein H8S90_17405 [Olivibacter sp. SDN3]|uniref:hypothetical protein n=1 Tax=Olivibacter sp. SDN3 TaxID=2764720 RepID=UPI0016511EA5|nr:hypothetical protein [Olivibacter sp. SDN3]QNL48552.1 hypothetical protein H8S90_17405 [Olivibacter sp. SDN3]